MQSQNHVLPTGKHHGISNITHTFRTCLDLRLNVMLKQKSSRRDKKELVMKRRNKGEN